MSTFLCVVVRDAEGMGNGGESDMRNTNWRVPSSSRSYWRRRGGFVFGRYKFVTDCSGVL